MKGWVVLTAPSLQSLEPEHASSALNDRAFVERGDGSWPNSRREEDEESEKKILD